MPTQIHAAGPQGERSPGLDAAIAGYLDEHGGGGGVEVVSGTVTLDGSGSPVREFYCTGSATIAGVEFDAGDVVVFRRTPGNAWGYIIVDEWAAVPGDPEDETPPTPGTLAASAITDTTFTLTVSGASDETALHATPYAFSIDDGVTWTSYQSSPVFNVTDAAPETSYDCAHRVRDAALNVATGTSIEVVTEAAEEPPPASGTLTYRGEHATWSDVSTLTYADAPLGDADADRWVIVMVTWWSGNNRDNTDLTIGGNAATRVHRAELTTQQGCNVWVAHVPSGTTADIVATMTNLAQPSIAVWTTDAEIAFVAAANTIASASADTATVTPTSVADGFVVAGYRSRSNAFLADWSGINERWDTGASNQPGSGGDATTPSTTHPITVDWDPAITQVTRVTAATFEWV